MFDSPSVCVGQVILWSDGPGSRQEPAIVLKIGTGSLNVSLHSDHTKDHVIKTGVRHRNDPWIKAHPEHAAGVWDLTARDKQIDRVVADLSQAVARVLAFAPEAVAIGEEDD